MRSDSSLSEPLEVLSFEPPRDGSLLGNYLVPYEILAKGGIAAVAQAGGSIRDSEVIAAADEHGIAMAFTGLRLFKH